MQRTGKKDSLLARFPPRNWQLGLLHFFAALDVCSFYAHNMRTG